VFIVILRFSNSRAKAPELMQAHKDWISDGFDDGVFFLAGSLAPGQGGALLAHGVSYEELQSRIEKDPFVAEDVVTAEILTIAPARVDDSLGFLRH